MHTTVLVNFFIAFRNTMNRIVENNSVNPVKITLLDNRQLKIPYISKHASTV
jgi:hypothetical protein